MTIKTTPDKNLRARGRGHLFGFHLTNTTRDFAKVPAVMQSRHNHDLQEATSEGELALDSELGILRDVFRLLPSGVTVQDEQGRFLLVNDAAAAQFGIAAAEPAPSL